MKNGYITQFGNILPEDHQNNFYLFQMVFLPEACDYIGESKAQTLAMAESLNGDLIKAFCNSAKENEIWLSLGGIHEQVSCSVEQPGFSYDRFVLPLLNIKFPSY